MGHREVIRCAMINFLRSSLAIIIIRWDSVQSYLAGSVHIYTNNTALALSLVQSIGPDVVQTIGEKKKKKSAKRKWRERNGKKKLYATDDTFLRSCHTSSCTYSVVCAVPVNLGPILEARARNLANACPASSFPCELGTYDVTTTGTKQTLRELRSRLARNGGPPCF